jgi:hypothetical protein
MSLKSVWLPMPTRDLVTSYVQDFDQTQAVVACALSKLFRLFPENAALEDVLLKVVTLNDLYRTGIFATYQVAEHILQLKIDPLLQAGQSDAIDLIAYVQFGNKTRNNYSFATKYCAWHNQDAFPIYDSFVEEMLWGYRKQDHFATFQRQELWVYHKFKHIIMTFCEFYNLSAFDFKDIDKFLWLAGKEYYSL